MRKICVFTGTRAEYGLLKPLLYRIYSDDDLELQLIVSGTHLSPEFDYTYRTIESDGFVIDEKVEMILSSDTPTGICTSMGLGLIGYCGAIQRLSPDIIVILGDRYEAFVMAATATVCRVPVAHIHGGELTQGAIDEAFRHSITKMSHLHFASTEEYRKRIIQLGEQPINVFDVGAIGLDNIRELKLLTKEELESDIGFDLTEKYCLVTYHPVTLEKSTAQDQFEELLAAFDMLPSVKIIFTKANADTGGRIINKMIDEYVSINYERSVAFTSMGQLRYLSAMKYSSAVVGNSSSGIIEAPDFMVPTVNIGDRQKGRVRAQCILDCSPYRDEIELALKKVIYSENTDYCKNPYSKVKTAIKIKDHLKNTDFKKKMKKTFFDIVTEK